MRYENAFAWIGLHEPTEEEFEPVRREFLLHQLAVEDAVTAHQRPKLEVYDDMLFVVLKTARYVEAEEIVEFGEIAAVRRRRLRHHRTPRRDQPSTTSAATLEDRPDLLRCGPGAALHAIVDRVVDDYAPASPGSTTTSSEVEEEVFSGTREPAQRIYKLKREVLELHEAVGPLPEPLDQLPAGEVPERRDGTIRPYFRDVHDHLLRIVDQVASFRDLLTGVPATATSRRRASGRTRTCADLGLGCDHRRADRDRGAVRHELRQHAGAPLAVRLPARPRRVALVCLVLYRSFRRSGWLWFFQAESAIGSLPSDPRLQRAHP